MNEALKRAQANYQDKCRILNVRFNKETEQERIDWLDQQGSVSASIKLLIDKDIRERKEHKVIVGFYSADFRITKDIEDYIEDELLAMGQKRAEEGVDTLDREEVMNEFEARKIDGKCEIDRVYTNNNLKYVSLKWSFINELYPELDEEDDE